MKEPQDEEQRRRAVAWAIALTAETKLAPDEYEATLLAQYVEGSLTLSQVLAQLDNRVQHILYRSQAVRPLTSAQCTDLLEESRLWNEQHNITGLLCYSEPGYFVQVIEGPPLKVAALFTKIRQDKRHRQVTLLSDQGSANRWFADWRMAYVEAKPNDFFWLMGYLEARSQSLIQPLAPICDPQLLELLSKFSRI